VQRQVKEFEAEKGKLPAEVWRSAAPDVDAPARTHVATHGLQTLPK
jgi:hypothetical protein